MANNAEFLALKPWSKYGLKPKGDYDFLAFTKSWFVAFSGPNMD